jgi:glycosyltransferase involved in cell wall biosynthesis
MDRMKKQKIIFLVPGSGGAFYCQNCCRDYVLVKELRKLGYDASIVPMYLPLSLDDPQMQEEKRLFYGALRVYLNEKIPFFAQMPLFLKKSLNALPLLKHAAKISKKASSSGMEKITLSLLKGEEGQQKQELEELVSWLKHDEKPDAIILSNALLSGLAKSMQKNLGIPIFCFLQDEHQWIDTMPLSYQEKIWEAIQQQSDFIQGFLPVSHFYSQFIQKKLHIPASKFHVLYPGIQIENYPLQESSLLAIGYISRLNKSLGFDILLDAFCSLKEQAQFSEWKLFFMGGNTAEDEKFLSQAKKILK